jgi:hypothetical protein
MTKQDLQSLGITPDEVLTRVADRICEQFISEEKDYAHDFQSRIERAVKKRVDEVLDKAMSKHVLPKVTSMVEELTLTETNKWGEAKKEPVTFIEYLVQRADCYIREEVDYNGKIRSEDTYQWRAHSTRIAHMIHEHLAYHIKRAMEQAMGNATTSVKKGLEEACKIAIAGIQVKVNTEVQHA